MHSVPVPINVRCCLSAQPVDATQALNRSAGVANPRVLRGRSLSCRATLLSWACEYGFNFDPQIIAIADEKLLHRLDCLD